MFITKLLGICFLCFLAAGRTVARKQRNVTIDDKYGDESTGIVPTYLPSHAWSSGPREDLSAKPNVSIAYNGTWHDSTHWVNNTEAIVNFGFTGVAIYVYCIIANAPPPLFDAFADYNFLLDGDFVGEYRHDVEREPDYLYNVPVYVNTTMQNMFHNFSIVVNSTEKAVLLLFDYATYTVVEEEPVVPSTSARTAAPTIYSPPPLADQPTNNTAANVEVIVQVGAALGVLAFFILVGAFIFHLSKKPRISVLQGATLRYMSHVPKNLATSIYRKIVRTLSRLGESGGLAGDNKGQSSIAQVRSKKKETELDYLPQYVP
ncbi:hypothetical protein PLEOSDRAFT_159520 [Pleurotus ostreatus PC15]|uniref:Uncharacterized protein n=1 Tax=Pleurotus ostreatus (strain PC15) TaxID=1137138 RepID=A0A067NSE8_PLEO1|nr:hypothetical protein PLEOSDRAFT_159520 [Pleurotus ostreatus PC15]